MEHGRAAVRDGAEPGVTRQAVVSTPLLQILPVSAAAILYLAGFNFVYENRPWWGHLPGFVVVFVAFSLSLWTGERLWRTTVGSLFSFQKLILIFLSKLPFWALAGGIGWEIGLLLAKRYGLLTVYDIPIRSWFIFGCTLGVLIQIIVSLLIDRLMRGTKRRATSATDHHEGTGP